jgi:hypothetical protein
MFNPLLHQLQQWLDKRMRLSSPPSLKSLHTQPPLEIEEAETMLPSSVDYSMVSHENVYHPRRKNTLLLRSGQTVSHNLLEKLYQFGIDVAEFCSLKEKTSGMLHPLTEETIAWLPSSQPLLQKTMVIPRPQNTAFSNPALPDTTGVTAPFSPKFEEMLRALKACPLPHLLVLNPIPVQQRKFGKTLEAIGIDYQQVNPVFTLETLSYALHKYNPHTLIIDEAWWQQMGFFQKAPQEALLKNLEAFITALIEVLQTNQAQYENEARPNAPHLLFVLTPQMAYKTTIINVISRLNNLTHVRILWKPYKRYLVKEALTGFLQTTEVQLERRQEVQTFAR